MNELHIFEDKRRDFYAVICLQRDGRGPAIGGCRILDYPSTDLAVQDAVRLSQAMRYKAAVSELPHDGGKAVILRPKNNTHRIHVLNQFAACVDSLNGKYITTIDSGTNSQDMKIIKNTTHFVTGYLPEEEDNPSFSTAKGVFFGMQAGAKLVYGDESLAGLHIGVQGIGQVGYLLCQLLHQAGARLSISDTDREKITRCAAEFNANIIAPENIYRVPCDIFSPCALGQIINSETIMQLNTRLISGAANDQLSSPSFAEQLAERGILYLPDFVINAGGLIHLSMRWQHPFQDNSMENISDRIEHRLNAIYDRIIMLDQEAKKKKKTLLAMAMMQAEKILQNSL